MSEYYVIYKEGDNIILRDILYKDTATTNLEGYFVKQGYDRGSLTLSEYADRALRALHKDECVILKKVSTYFFETDIISTIATDFENQLVDISPLFPQYGRIIKDLINDLHDSAVLGGDSRAVTYSWKYGKIYITLVTRKRECSTTDVIIIKDGDEVIANVYRIGTSIFIEEFKEDCGVFSYMDYARTLEHVLPTYEEWFKFIEHKLGKGLELSSNEDAVTVITKHLRDMNCDNIDKVCKELKRLRDVSNSSDFSVIAGDITSGKSGKAESGIMKAINAMMGK